MEAWQRKHITKCMVTLLTETRNLSLLIRLLIAEDVLGQPDKVTIEAKSNAMEQVAEFYDTLITRVNSYEKLIRVLKEQNQHGAADILEMGYAEAGVKSPFTVEASPQNFAPAAPHPQPPQQPQHYAPPRPPTTTAEIKMGTPMHDDDQPDNLDRVDFDQNMKPLEVEVVKPKTRMAFPDDSYGLREDNKGYCLILNITEFMRSDRNRNGAPHDTNYMRTLWTSLGYEVTVHEGSATCLQVESILNDFSRKCSQDGPSSCVIYVGSHGEFSKIETSEGQTFNLYEHLVYKFNNGSCPGLKGKPKIFIIQACQRFQSDATPAAKPPLEMPIDDCVVCYSTIPGYVAKRDVFLGTWYTYCLTKVLMEEAHRMDFLKMLKKTQETMKNIVTSDYSLGQLSTYMDMGLKTLYFNMYPD